LGGVRIDATTPGARSGRGLSSSDSFPSQALASARGVKRQAVEEPGCGRAGLCHVRVPWRSQESEEPAAKVSQQNAKDGSLERGSQTVARSSWVGCDRAHSTAISMVSGCKCRVLCLVQPRSVPDCKRIGRESTVLLRPVASSLMPAERTTQKSWPLQHSRPRTMNRRFI
jgi:hypothetical protein